MSLQAWIVTLIGLAVLLGSCGSARRGEPIVGPPTLSRQAAAGETAFMTHCQQCHPGGQAGLGPAINDKPLPGFLIAMQVRNGFGAMPAFPRDEVSKAELDGIVAYLKALRRNE